MERTPDDLVTEFCTLWAAPDTAKLTAFFAEDAVYHNIPMKPLRGRAAIEAFIAASVRDYDGIDFIVHSQISDGQRVMNERTDVLRRKDGVSVRLPVMGVFEVSDDRIVGWRDYFDLATVTKAFD